MTNLLTVFGRLRRGLTIEFVRQASVIPHRFLVWNAFMNLAGRWANGDDSKT
jgi:hypothetical protein